MDWQRLGRRFRSRALVTVVGFTGVLTAGFVGLRALAFGDAGGVAGRVAYYVLAAAIAFVAALWRLDEREIEGLPVLLSAGGIAVAAGLLAGLAIEGIVAAIQRPGEVLTSDLLVYFTAAALICTGLGIWGLRHWREFASVDPTE